MEESQTKYIESSLTAFRAIKSFVFQKGAYPRTFDNGTWKEEDYSDSDYRRVIRDDFEHYLELLVYVYNNCVIPLVDALPHIESEYNNLVINSRNMEQAVKLFKDKYEEAMFVIEWKMDINKTLGNYLNPLLEHEIIHSKEGDAYQDLICKIGMAHCQTVNIVCDIFNIERPWYKNRPDAGKIEQVASTGANEGNHEEVVPQTDTKQSSQPAPTPNADNTVKRKLPTEFADYFIASFKGFGNGNINYYKRLEEDLTETTRERSVIEYAKIALLIYNSKKMTTKKPQTFSEWYQYFCKIVGCEYNKDYKPSKLKASEGLMKEFSYLFY